MRQIRIGTRGSKLALWQAYYIRELLRKAGIASEIITIETKGDKVLEVTLSKIGSKGVFTEELEAKLKTNEIDIAVHSAKDLPSHLGNGLEIIAFTEREKTNDVVVSFDPGFNLKDTSKEIVVGTSSTRRVALLKYFYPHVKVVDMRGNLQTRFEKLKNGNCHAMILAYAGVHRMNYDEFIVQDLPLDQFTPPVGQGAVAVESATGLDISIKSAIREAVNHKDSEICLLAEREFLKTMNGGCSVPTFALCHHINDKEIHLKGGIISLDGSRMAIQMMTVHKSKSVKAGEILAKKVLKIGGEEILSEIRKTQENRL